MVGKEDSQTDCITPKEAKASAENESVITCMDELPFPEKILIIKPSSLGDVISALPVLHGLRRTFPCAHIAWLVNAGFTDILEGENDLDEIIPLERRRFGKICREWQPTIDFWEFCNQLRAKKFDWVIDLQGLFRSGFFSYITGASLRAGFADTRELARLFYTHPFKPKATHTIDRNITLARSLGVDVRRDDFKLNLSEKIFTFVRSFLEQNNLSERRYIVIAHGTRWESKLYPTHHWQKVVGELVKDLPIVLIGSPEDVQRSAEIASAIEGGRIIDATGKTTPAEAAGIIGASAVVVCCDSAANFIAPAVGVPAITLIGPTRVGRTGPYGGRSRAIIADIPCQGCLKRTCPHVAMEGGFATCMQLIEPEKVIETVRAVLYEEHHQENGRQGNVNE
ncbi:hypothetical protein DRQ00_12255 [candidate division KSB1 bacterium]|nr:MAG: hypothetical protein DRQ00_12255 [candidate division KSB1 bacterium]